jgi:NAD(P)-dependent dehydrogenase (short-subunit alcohol dehydrogenase family)
MHRLEGKIAVITGGARGIGAEHARLFASEGAHVLTVDVRDDEGESLAAGLRSSGLDVHYLHLDVAAPADWNAAVALAERRWAKLDILVNNAGIVGSRASAEDETELQWQAVCDINQRGVWLGMKTCVPAMRRAGGGAIVNIASIQGIVGIPDYFSYQASKGAVRMMSKSAALTYALDNIRVNTVCPGHIETEMAKEDGAAANAEAIAATPLRRPGEPRDIAFGSLYLCSDEARFITGAELIIDGGYTAR